MKSKLTYDMPLQDGKRNTILQWLMSSQIVEKMTCKILNKSEKSVQDIIQELWTKICEIPQETWDDLYSQGKASVSGYVVGLIYRQLISVNSDIYKKYNQYKKRFILKSDLFWEYYDLEGNYRELYIESEYPVLSRNCIEA